MINIGEYNLGLKILQACEFVIRDKITLNDFFEHASLFLFC